MAPISGLRITYLPQEARFDSDRSIREEAQEAFAAALKAAEHMREIEQALGTADADEFDRLMAEYERLHAHFEVGGGYDIEHRTEEVLVGLGFAEEQFDTPVHVLSGGQKTRVALAKALLADPDLLLLDEPTNHLDLTMLEWLEGFLATWRGACLIVSHDRYFLDRVTSAHAGSLLRPDRGLPRALCALPRPARRAARSGSKRNTRSNRPSSPAPRSSSASTRPGSARARPGVAKHGSIGWSASSGRRITPNSRSASSPRSAAARRC